MQARALKHSALLRVWVRYLTACLAEGMVSSLKAIPWPFKSEWTVSCLLWVQGDALVVCYLRDVHSALQLRSLSTGKLQQDIPLPGLGCVSDFSSDRKDSEAFFSYVDYTSPGSTFRSCSDCARRESLHGEASPRHACESAE